MTPQMISRSKVRVFESAMEKLGRILAEKYKIKVIFRHDTCMTDGKTIYLPVIPDNASDEFLGAVQGFLDHEVAHIIFTELSVMKNLKRRDRKKWNIFQSLEDIRIETAMRNLWRGAGVNLKRCNEWSLKQLKDHWEELSNFGKLCQGIGIIGLEGMNHWFVEEVLKKEADLMPRLQKIEQMIIETKELPDTKAVLQHAGDIMKSLAEEEEPEEESEEEPIPAPASGDMGDPDDDELDEEESEGDEEDEEEGGASGSGGGGEEEDEDSDQESGPESDEEDGEGDGDPLNVSDQELEKDEQLTSRHNMLRNAAKQEMTDEDRYLIYTTEGDQVEKISDGDRVQVHQFLLEARGMVNVLLKKMRMNLLSIARSKWVADKRRGHVNPKAIFRVPLGTSKRVFRQKVTAPSFNTVCSLWIDHSGSMEGYKLEMAEKAAILFGEVLDELGIPFEVCGYSTVDYNTGVQRHDKATKDERKIFSRFGNLWVGVYKSFSDDWRMVKHHCANMARNQKFNTYDGESVRMAAARLLQRKEDRRILFVFNDGEPCPNLGHLPGHIEQHRRYLKEIAKEVEKLVELFAIGIQSSSVKQYYSNAVTISSLEELPQVMLQQLDQMLRKGTNLIKKAG